MKAAYIGILTPGTTSRLRAESLRRQTPAWDWDWIDTDGPMMSRSRVWRSLAFRRRSGPVVFDVNRLVHQGVQHPQYRLIWVDKGVYLRPATVAALRERGEGIVHYTPDTAFYGNQSRHFERSLALYDLLVTTKSFEVAAYQRHGVGDRLLLTTQGYDAHLHAPRVPDEERRREAVFIGLAEPDREQCLHLLLDAGVPVRLGGRGWERFLRQRGDDAGLSYLGDAVFGEAYSRALSEAWVGLGLLSKRFPERHTTRTFEIPACGAILATERTEDTARFFEPSEALLVEDYIELAARVRALLEEASLSDLTARAAAGRRRVDTDKRDYDRILSAILADPRLDS